MEQNNTPNEVFEEVTPKSMKILKEIGSWVLCILVALVVAFLIRTYVFTMVRVDGLSMYPTLNDNERLFARIIGYTPERGDVIIFHPKSNPEVAYVKRVIALEGDRIWIDDEKGEVHLKKNGSDTWEILDEPYINETYPGEFPIQTQTALKNADDSGEDGLLIKKDHIFVLGDNRNHSTDSRMLSVDQVSLDSVIGKASFRWWPLSEFGKVK